MNKEEFETYTKEYIKDYCWPYREVIIRKFYEYIQEKL